MKEKRIVIRKATLKDLKAIQRLNFKLFKKEFREYDKTLNTKWPYTPNGKKYFISRIQDKSGFVRVAMAGEKIVGYMCGGWTKPKSYQKKVLFAELENTFIEPAFRNKGIGSRFIKDFLRWCKSEHVVYVTIAASANNSRAIDFYHANGFKNLDTILLKKI